MCEDLRREQIVSHAMRLYEEQGIEATSVRDIMRSVGVSRSLLYHYFPDKEAVTEAVLDRYLQEFVDRVHAWDDAREPGDVRGSVRTCVAMIRSSLGRMRLFDDGSPSGDDATLYLAFTRHAVETLSRLIVSTTVVDYARVHEIEIEHVYETFYMLISGLIALVRMDPGVADETLEGLIAQTLHLDLG